MRLITDGAGERWARWWREWRQRRCRRQRCGHAGGSSGSGGVGVAGQGGGFQCAGLVLEGSCRGNQVGLVCIQQGEAPLPCTCLPGNGGPTWQCNTGTSPCPAMEPGTRSVCAPSIVSTVTGFGGCKYPPEQVCSCAGSADGGAGWACNDVTCPSAPPTGLCASSDVQDGRICSYNGGTSSCSCDGSHWSCNGQMTPAWLSFQAMPSIVPLFRPVRSASTRREETRRVCARAGSPAPQSCGSVRTGIAGGLPSGRADPHIAFAPLIARHPLRRRSVPF
jgi:hypothetical protein